MVSAWASANRLVLGQRKVAEKSNEITAIPELLHALDLRGGLVTIDAIGCQTAIARTIVEQQADYLLALKANQGQLYADVALLFADLVASHYQAYPHDHAKMINKDHGRLEAREAWTINAPHILAALRRTADFPGLTTVMMVRLDRRIGTDVTVEWRHFISSATTSAAQLLRHKRTHWRIEDSLHWVLDIVFREDESRLNKGHGAQNFAILRHIALNLLKQETTCKLGTFNKRLKAACDPNYLLTVLETLFQ